MKNEVELPAETRELPYLAHSYHSALGAGSNDKLYYFHANHLGSGSLITDGQGNTYQTIIYDPHGGILADIKNGTYDERAKFNGGELDQESRQYHTGARNNDPNLNIWTSTEPKCGTIRISRHTL
jgi:RHS repeat-associated protein